VPTISRFYGIVIGMYFREHPPPHFHVNFAEHHARVRIADATVIDGDLPPRAERMVRRWTSQHREELERNWLRARRGHSLRRIEPLR